jgi:hypothetical protein
MLTISAGGLCLLVFLFLLFGGEGIGCLFVIGIILIACNATASCGINYIPSGNSNVTVTSTK